MKLFRRILVPHDFSAPADRALALASELARRHGGRLIVLYVVRPFEPITAFPADVPYLPQELIGGELPRLKALVARRVRGRNAPRVECRVVMGDPFQRIAAAARGADSIVMATAGRTGLSHMLIGSVAEKVVRHSPVPVLTVRALAGRAETRGRGVRRRTHDRRAARRR